MYLAKSLYYQKSDVSYRVDWLKRSETQQKTNPQNRGFELSVILALALLLLILFSLCKYFLSIFFTKRMRGAALLELNIDN